MMFEVEPHLAAAPATRVPDGNTIPVPNLRQPDLLKKLESRPEGPGDNIEVSSFYRDAKIVWSIQMEPSIALKK